MGQGTHGNETDHQTNSARITGINECLINLVLNPRKKLILKRLKKFPQTLKV
jgi:hypothetical protein